MGFTPTRLPTNFGSEEKIKNKKIKKIPQLMGFTPTSLLQNFGSDEKKKKKSILLVGN